MKRADLDGVIKKTLQEFCSDLSNWFGREREMVSLYAFGHLAPCCREHSALKSCTQIGIEVAVRQVPSGDPHVKRRPQVCKDVVIWPVPKMTCWDSDGQLCDEHEPIVVMEWKVIHDKDSQRSQARKRKEHELDICWLEEKSNRVANFTGYAVIVHSTHTLRELRCVRVSDGKTDRDWLRWPPADEVTSKPRGA